MDSLIETSIGVCNYMLDPASPGGIPRTLLSKCAGVAIFHSLSAAAFVSASSASGIVLRRDDGMDEWSPPSAVSMKDVGVGITFGVKRSDIIMVLMDDNAVKTMCAGVGLKLGSNVSVVAGPLANKGKAVDYDGDINLSKEGTGITYCYSLSEGVLAGFDINAGVIVAGNKVNSDFYQAQATPEDILFKKGSVSIPSDSRIPELHKKLNMMEKGVLNLQ
jgi:lipid-binding SYLF domain-containing protein